LKDLSPDSTSLLPIAITLADFGNIVVVRRNIVFCSKYTSGKLSFDITFYSMVEFLFFMKNIGVEGEAFIYRLKSIGEQICQSRFPPSKLIIINSPGTPLDRILYSRLSPSHVDTIENICEQINLIPEFSWITKDDVVQLVKCMPVTDQIHFKQYMTLQAPTTSLRSNLAKDVHGSKVPSSPPSGILNLPPRPEVMERDLHRDMSNTPVKNNQDNNV
jgi:hypothetical protein